MRKPAILKLCALLCAVVILNACKKEVSTNKEIVSNQNTGIRNSGVVSDDPANVAKVPTLMSSDFFNSSAARAGTGTGGKKTDTDRDGIPDATDACPTQKETVNGYLDTDGCPDTVPPPNATDTDGDGIPDATDACPTQRETVNGYQDTDGCPDTVPDTDGDGIADQIDSCPTQAENFNGFEDTDGCPDTPPVIIPPTPIPSSFQLITPTPGNQGNEGSCVPFAIAYGARSIEQYYKTGASSYSTATNIFSPEYAYNQVWKADCGTGTAVTLVLDLIKNQGVSTWQSMPYDDTNGCSILPTASQNANASAYKISSYVKIPNTDHVAIKTMVVSKHPVIITITADDSFVNAGPGFIWKTYSGSGNLPHTLIICGYDDAKHAYKVMSSWGTQWSDAGFSWIDYDLLPQKSSTYFYAIQ